MSKAFRKKEEGDGLHTSTHISANNYFAGETYSTTGKGHSRGNHVNENPVKKIQGETDDPAFLFPQSFPG